MAFGEELRRAARTLREHHEQSVVFEQALGVLGKSRKLAGSARPFAEERKPADEFLRHSLGEPGRIHFQETGGDDHGGVDGDSARVVAYNEGATASGYVRDSA